MTAPFHSRDEWAVRHPSFGDLHLPVAEVYAHHTAGRYMPTFNVGDMRDAEEAEINRPNGGYVALAYHELYCGDGSVVESRPLVKMGGATLNKNTTSVAICLPGNYVGTVVSWAQAASAIDRLTAMAVYGIVTKEFRLRPHSDVYPTECPASFRDHLAGIRQDVATRLTNTTPLPPPIPPPPQPPGDINAFLAHLAEAVNLTRFVLAQGNVVALGAHNDSVWTVQLACNLASQSPRLVLDGIFGPATRTAVVAYQNRHGLVVDGVVGRLTYAKMYP